MATEAFAWIYLPGTTQAVVCGRLLTTEDAHYRFLYGRSYRERENAISLAPRGMPIAEAPITARRPGALPGPIRDAGPDAWARYAIEYRRGAMGFNELDLLLEGHGDRIGALDFSPSATELPHAPLAEVTLEDLEAAARGVQDAQPLPRHLLEALKHGTSIGGARPKATLMFQAAHWIAKFSSTTDRYRIVRWEAASLTLASEVGIRVPEHRLARVNDRDVLLVKRFDREPVAEGVTRKLMLSALTLLELDETEGPLASYPDLAEVLLRDAADPAADRRELYRRMVFNILIGNEDDHARNHACFWDGRFLSLTPVYDLMPLPRTGLEGRQAMIVGELGEGGRASTLANALTSARQFGLESEAAREIAMDVLDVVSNRWEAAFTAVEVPAQEIEMLRGRAVLSPLAVAME